MVSRNSIDDDTAKEMLSLYKKGTPIRGVISWYLKSTGTRYAYASVRNALIRVGGVDVMHPQGGVSHRMEDPAAPRNKPVRDQPGPGADPEVVAIYNTLLPIQQNILRGLVANQTTREIARAEGVVVYTISPHIDVLRKRFKEPTNAGLASLARELFEAAADTDAS